MSNDIQPLSKSFSDIEGRLKKRPEKLNIPEDAVDRIADMLESKVHGNLESRPYYCKVARLLPAQTLERLVDTALEVGSHPGKLFTYLTKKEIARKYTDSDSSDE